MPNKPPTKIPSLCVKIYLCQKEMRPLLAWAYILAAVTVLLLDSGYWGFSCCGFVFGFKVYDKAKGLAEQSRNYLDSLLILLNMALIEKDLPAWNIEDRAIRKYLLRRACWIGAMLYHGQQYDPVTFRDALEKIIKTSPNQQPNQSIP